MWTFHNPLSTRGIWQTEAEVLSTSSVAATGSRHRSCSVFKLRCLDKQTVKPQAFALFSGQLHQAWESGSGISLHILPSGLQLLLSVLSLDMWSLQESNVYIFFFKLLVLHHSVCSLNIWKMVVKFLGTTLVLLIVQGWEDAAAS